MNKKLLIGFVTFGNVEFTKLTIESIEETVDTPFDIFVVVGMPGDKDTREYLQSKNIQFTAHDKNYGFPYGLNDIYDFCWKNNSYQYLVICGNDIYAYPFAIDSLVKVADTTDYECINALQYDVRSFTTEFPQYSKYFSGDRKIFTDFNSRCWSVYRGYSSDIFIKDGEVTDMHNLCLYKKSVFDRTGYIDTGYFPAYYEDNDFLMRMNRANVKFCTLHNARFFHFWSRTIHQGRGGSTNKYFENNRDYYIKKWGGDIGGERFSLPFDGNCYQLPNGVVIPPEINITSRENEKKIVEYWWLKGMK